MIVLNSVLNTIYVMFIGMGLVAAMYYAYRKWTRDRVVLYIFDKTRKFKKYAVRPSGDSNILNVKGAAYLYDETRILHTSSFFLKDLTPALIYAENRVTPVDLYHKAKGEDLITAKELGDIMNDATVRDFVNAQSNINPKQLLQTLVVASALQMGLLAAVAWWLNLRITELGV